MDQGTQDPAAAGGMQPPAGGQPGAQGGAQPVQPAGGMPAGAQPGAAQPPAGGQMAGGAQPVGGAQPGAAQPAGTQPQGEENYLRPRPPDSELGIGAVGDFQTSVACPPHPNTTFDESYFLKMLSGSISLTKNEKAKIVESIPKLSQYQIDELIKIFEEERRKFAELDEKHQVKIRELQNKQAEDWKDLEMAKQQAGKAEEDTAAAEALKAQLMGGGGDAPAGDEQPPAAAA